MGGEGESVEGGLVGHGAREGADVEEAEVGREGREGGSKSVTAQGESMVVPIPDRQGAAGETGVGGTEGLGS